MRSSGIYIIAVLTAGLVITSAYRPAAPAGETGIRLHFSNTVKRALVKLDTVTYSNPFGELYTISNFKYYIGHCRLNNPGRAGHADDQYHLVNEKDSSSMVFDLSYPAGSYTSLSFLLGVDSIMNVSGAQSGALDPLNGMFWTWNSGYVMAKLEGNSPQSPALNHKIEYHIGGFKGDDNIVQTISLNFPAGSVNVEPGKMTDVFIAADINAWWQGINDIHFTATPVCTTPGLLSKKIAENYIHMFFIQKIIIP